jgi:hypothetical protein
MFEINRLYNYILNKIRRVPNAAPRTPNVIGSPSGTVVPFHMGRIYTTRYSNWHHDPKPLIFILGSDAFYTRALNINYLRGYGSILMRMILNMKFSGKSLTGYIMYRYLKMQSRGMLKVAYRKYFTKYLIGKLVSDGVSQVPMTGKAMFFGDPFVRQLNNLIRPKNLINKVRMSPEESNRLKNEMGVAETQADQARRGAIPYGG